MTKKKREPVSEEHLGRYLNRELSWLRFNERVLEEARNPKHPLLERLKFLAIFESNLDEFYMVRISGLVEQFQSGTVEMSPDGRTPTEQLKLIAKVAEPLRRKAGHVYHKELEPLLKEEGLSIRPYSSLTPKKREELDAYFRKEVFPLCTPLVLHPATTVPFISNRSLNLLVELGDGEGETRLGRVKIPPILPRLVRLKGTHYEFVLLEEIIAHNLHQLFPGVKVKNSYLFRVIRDADVEIRELEASDLIGIIEETLRLRRFGDAVLLQHTPEMPKRIRTQLLKLLELEKGDEMVIDDLLGMELFWEFVKIDKPNLRYPPHLPNMDERFASAKDLFETIQSGDLLVHHPFDSFRTVETFVGSASQDPNVIGIKQTLYRVGDESPIVESLLDAAEKQKQVAVMVELKARFDESNNLVWAKALEREGVHVTYGFREMKTHCKLCLIVRKEPNGIQTYAHIGTGNYNPVTSRLYTDLGLFTCDEAITQDISELFNYLTGYSKHTAYRKLLVAPINLREGILERIEHEIRAHEKHGGGQITFKLNALVDPEMIEALYAASQAGVQVDLICRGACCLRPGVAGMSENIRVVSVVGRFLEHSRVYSFAHGPTYIGSADLMRRNLDRRIEVLVPVENPALIEHLEAILETYLRDNQQSWLLDPSGKYERLHSNGEEPFDAQVSFMNRV